MNIDLLYKVIFAMIVLTEIVILYMAHTLWKRGSRGGSLLSLTIAVLLALGIYAVYGDKIVQMFR